MSATTAAAAAPLDPDVALLAQHELTQRRTTAVQYLSQSLGAAHARAEASGAGKGAAVALSPAAVQPVDRRAALVAQANAARSQQAEQQAQQEQRKLRISPPANAAAQAEAAPQQQAKPPGRRAPHFARPRELAASGAFSPLRDGDDQAAACAGKRAPAPLRPAHTAPTGWVRVDEDGQVIEEEAAMEEDMVGEGGPGEAMSEDEEEWV